MGWLVAGLGMACGPATPAVPPVDAVGVACVEVAPQAMDFGAVAPGEVVSRTLTVANRCDGGATRPLALTRVAIGNADAPFSVSPLTTVALAPDASTTIEVRFAPERAGAWRPTLTIESDDPASPVVVVALSGRGAGPAIGVSPLTQYVGTGWIGCTRVGIVRVANTGTTALHVTDARVTPAAWTVRGPALPFEVPAGEAVEVTVAFDPIDAFASEARLEITSDDPWAPVTAVTLTGQGEPFAEAYARYVQPKRRQTDVLLVIGDDRDTTPHQGAWAAALDGFVDALEAARVDWRIAVIDAETPTLRGPVVTAASADPLGALAAQVAVGTAGVAANQTATQTAWEAHQPGEALAIGGDFHRADARLSVVALSAVDDASADRPAAEFVDFFVDEVKGGDPRRFAYSAIAPPATASACGPEAVTYAELVDLSGGVYRSICDPDWDGTAAAVAEASILAFERFRLPSDPVIATLAVQVTGEGLTEGWTYDATSRSVVFDVAPLAGAVVEVDYAASPAWCD